MATPFPLLLLVALAFAVEEFVLIRAVSTVAKSDVASRRLELAAIWLPALGMGLVGYSMMRYGGWRLDGALNIAATLLCLLALGLRYWSRRTLGRFFTIGVVRQDGHRVVRDGPYRFIRHPAYLALMLFYLGFPLVVGSYVGLIVLSLPAAAIFIALVVVEDRKLGELLGAEYGDYSRTTTRLLPGVW